MSTKFANRKFKNIRGVITRRYEKKTPEGRELVCVIEGGDERLNVGFEILAKANFQVAPRSKFLGTAMARTLGTRDIVITTKLEQRSPLQRLGVDTPVFMDISIDDDLNVTQFEVEPAADRTRSAKVKCASEERADVEATETRAGD